MSARSILSCLLIAAAIPAPRGLGAGEAVKIADGERIALIGDGLFEADRSLGHLELRLQRVAPGAARTVRNFGCSGDQVDGRARLNGMRGLIADLDEFKPTASIVHYGGNDAAAGAAGVDAFASGLTALLGEIRKHARQVVVLAPRLPREAAAYGEALRRAAGAGVLAPWSTPALTPTPTAPAMAGIPGILDDATARADAVTIERALGFAAPAWSVRIAGGAGSGEGATVAEVAAGPTAVRFTATAAMLPDEAATGTLAVAGLAAGRWSVRIDGTEAAVADAGDLAKGIAIAPDRAQAAALLRAIVAKNQLFARKWRPQNTHGASIKYIKGDLPAYDPLIAAADRRIDELRRPQARRFELIPFRN